jgi:hypothetical protein
MNVRPLLVAAACVLLGGHLLVPGPLAAQDKGKVKKVEKTGDEKLLEALGASWKAGDAKALAARFPARRKVSLRIPGADAGDYRAEQARSLLDSYFAGRSTTKVELRSVRETTGTFRVEYLRTADRRTVKADLLLVLGTEEKARVLVGVRESP